MLHAFVYRSRFLLLLLHLRLCKKQFFFWGKQKFVFRLSFKMNWCRLQVMSLVFIDVRESSLEHTLVVVKSQVTNPPNTSLTHPNQTFQILLFPPFDIFPCTNVFISEGTFFLFIRLRSYTNMNFLLANICYYAKETSVRLDGAYRKVALS